MKALNIEAGADEKGRNPLCPHCQKSLDVIKDNRSHLKMLSNMHVFACSYCYEVQSVIAVSR